MILLDTDMLTLLFQGHAGVRSRLRSAEEDVATTIIRVSRCCGDVLTRFFKAADADQLRRAHRRLLDSESQLQTVPIMPIDESVAQQFEQLLRNKKLRKIG